MSEASTSTSFDDRHALWRLQRPSPTACVGLLVLAQILIWTAVPVAVGRSLPLDVVSDGLAWGHEWQWGYYKHPPLPSWEVEAFFDAFGDVGPYLLSQLTIGFTYLFVFLLGRELMDAKWAAAGTALTACIYFFSIPTPEFNHNVAQMPLWAATAYAYFKSIRTRDIRWWLALGAIAGVALLTKYASAVLLLTVATHLLSAPSRRRMLRSARPYAALAVCGLIVSPHLVWLYHHHFPTLSYAAHRAGQAVTLSGRIFGPLRFLLSQILDISPAIAVAAVCGFIGRVPARIVADENLRLLAWLTIGPAALTALLSLATGMGLRDMWGAPMWSCTGLLIVYAMQSRWPGVSFRRMSACITAAFVLLPAAYVLSTSTIPALRGKPSRTQWPDRAMAQTFDRAWWRATGHPLQIVASDAWLGGLVAMRTASRPSVFIDANSQEAPWITKDRLARDGALVIWPGDKPIPRSLSKLPQMKPMGTAHLPWPDDANLKPLAIAWGIVQPHGNDRGKGAP